VLGQTSPAAADDGVPWQALRYIISEINYGGRVTDRWDMHLLSVYARKFFCPEVLSQQSYRFSCLPTYFVPEDGPLQSFADYIQSLPLVDKPEAFGQHPNADIASQIQEGTDLLSSLLSLQPRTSAAGAGTVSREQRLLALIADLLKRLPAENIDTKLVAKLRKEDPGGNPLLTVLWHEVARYNRLLDSVRASLQTLKKGLLGLIVMSAELDEMATCLFDGRVPPGWKTIYPSLRPLFPWVADLLQRVEMFSNWAQDRQPAVFWLGGFTFPTGFLTSLLQKFSLKNNVSIDTLGWEFMFLREPASAIREPPADGAFISGMFLEGAGWDDTTTSLREPAPMELDTPMPVVHFRPVELKRKIARDPATVYQCPCYLWPVRDNSNREKPSYMLTMEVPSGKEKPDYWTLRGTAVILSK
jgi:dynein heavy chain